MPIIITIYRLPVVCYLNGYRLVSIVVKIVVVIVVKVLTS